MEKNQIFFENREIHVWGNPFAKDKGFRQILDTLDFRLEIPLPLPTFVIEVDLHSMKLRRPRHYLIFYSFLFDLIDPYILAYRHYVETNSL